MELAYGMRGIAGPNDASFRCFGDECLPAQVVPEPVTLVLLGTGLVGIGALRRRSRRVWPRTVAFTQQSRRG